MRSVNVAWLALASRTETLGEPAFDVVCCYQPHRMAHGQRPYLKMDMDEINKVKLTFGWLSKITLGNSLCELTWFWPVYVNMEAVDIQTGGGLSASNTQTLFDDMAFRESSYRRIYKDIQRIPGYISRYSEGCLRSAMRWFLCKGWVYHTTVQMHKCNDKWHFDHEFVSAWYRIVPKLRMSHISLSHYSDVTMSAMASQITGVSIVCSRSKIIWEPRATGLCEGNPVTMTGRFPSQRASNAENVSIWWRHHGSRLMIGTEGEQCGTPLTLVLNLFQETIAPNDHLWDMIPISDHNSISVELSMAQCKTAVSPVR